MGTTNKTAEIAPLSPEAAMNIRNRIKNEESMLKTGAEFGDSDMRPLSAAELAVEPDQIKNRIKQLQSKLDQYELKRETDPVKREAMAKEAEALEEKIMPYMQTPNELHSSFNDSDWYQACEKAREHIQNPELRRNINRWKLVRRTLEPEDPDACNLRKMYFRHKKR